jgi:hypothetical protein
MSFAKPILSSEMIHKDYKHKGSVSKKKISGRDLQGAWRHDELTGGKPPVAIQLFDSEGGTRLSSWFRHYTTSRKVAGSSPDKVTEFFEIGLILPEALWSWGRFSF